MQGFLAEGLQRTSAGLGSVIIDSQPLTVALLAAIFFGERLRPLGVAGLGVGVLGLCLLEVPPEAVSGGPHLDLLYAHEARMSSEPNGHMTFRIPKLYHMKAIDAGCLCSLKEPS